jgi:hypothetical protein
LCNDALCVNKTNLIPLKHRRISNYISIHINIIVKKNANSLKNSTPFTYMLAYMLDIDMSIHDINIISLEPIIFLIIDTYLSMTILPIPYLGSHL